MSVLTTTQNVKIEKRNIVNIFHMFNGHFHIINMSTRFCYSLYSTRFEAPSVSAKH